MAEAVPRPLTSREQAALVALITRGVSADGDVVVTGEDRDRWLQQVPDTRAGDRCNCGTCPSIELTDRSGTTPGEWDRRVVLEAGAAGALLLLFVDDDRLSYLELAPLDDKATFREFPDPEEFDFTA